MIARLVQLACDHRDCGARTPPYLPVYRHRAIVEARHQARGTGWTHRDGRDLCPQHSGGRR